MESLPHHIAAQCSDVQLRMLHIQHPNKHQEYFEVFRKLKHSEVFTDVTFVTKSGRSLSVHRAVLASYSKLIKDMLEDIFDLHYKILVPEVEYSDVEALCHILYGVDVAVPRSRFDKIYNLADMLGIPVSKLNTPEAFLLDPNEPRLVNKQTPPLCCWHCNRTFAQIKELQKHLDTQHKNETATVKTAKRHKCSKCKKIFPTMWKLRTHLLTHANKKTVAKRGDHEYAEPIKSSSLQHQRKTISDHPYANPTDSTPAPTPNGHDQGNNKTRAADRVSSDHSYGTRQRLASIREGDHAYSTKMPTDDDVDKAQDQTIFPTDVQLVWIKSKDPPPPGSTVLAEEPPASAKPAEGSAKRKSKLKIRKVFEPINDSDSASGSAASMGSSNKKYQCDFCGKVFPQPYRKNRHVLEVHKQEKRHSCQYCEKSFFKVSSKKRHEMTHVTHETWKCAKCSKVFKDQSSLKYHTKKLVCSILQLKSQ